MRYLICILALLLTACAADTYTGLPPGPRTCNRIHYGSTDCIVGASLYRCIDDDQSVVTYHFQCMRIDAATPAERE